MSVESKAAKVATIATALFVASGVGLILRERVVHRKGEEKSLQLQKAKELAEDSNRSGDAGVVDIRGKFLLEPKPV